MRSSPVKIHLDPKFIWIAEVKGPRHSVIDGAEANPLRFQPRPNSPEFGQILHLKRGVVKPNGGARWVEGVVDALPGHDVVNVAFGQKNVILHVLGDRQAKQTYVKIRRSIFVLDD